VNIIKNNIENEIKIYYKDFEKDFTYISYFISYKCKPNTTNASRNCIIEKYDNIISVNCGKILGIFELEDYIKNILKLIFF
jgi:hypothetical protein